VPGRPFGALASDAAVGCCISIEEAIPYLKTEAAEKITCSDLSNS
jgi:hypothetical protein